jgi:acetyl esterase/lipase
MGTPSGGWCAGLYGILPGGQVCPPGSFPLKDVDLQGQIGDHMSFLEKIRQAINLEGTSNRAIRLAYGPGAFQFGDLRLPAGEGPHPTVVLIHGGYWRSRYGLKLMTGLAKDLAARGYAAWNIEYRRVGNPGGGWPGTFLDVARAADYLREIAPTYALDLQQVVPIGHSAGGHLALWLAGRPRIPAGNPLAGSSIKGDNAGDGPFVPAGAISLAGVVDLAMAWRLHLSMDAVVELLGGTPDEVPERYAATSPATLLPLGVPQVLFHGTADVNVPIEVSQAYAKAALTANDPVTCIELPGVDHFDVIDPGSEAWERIIKALEGCQF